MSRITMTDTAALVPCILVVDDDFAFVQTVATYAIARGCQVRHAPNLDAAAASLLSEAPADLTLLDISLPDGNGLDLLERLPSDLLHKVVMMTGFPDASTVSRAFYYPILDYVVKPLRAWRFDRLLDQAGKNAGLRRSGGSLEGSPETLATGAAFRLGRWSSRCENMGRVFANVRKIAPLAQNVLLQGESGTGKELVARALHEFSDRRGRFVAVNCGALQLELAGSQLFGHSRGSFTGAIVDHVGVFEQAQDGTLFLDEITEMPIQLQANLLRLLEEKVVTPIGSRAARPVNARVVAASNRSPTEAVRDGFMRADLFYRLAEFEISLPPLRLRHEDIIPLAEQCVAEQCRVRGRLLRLSSRSYSLLMRHSWPGNVRELRNVVTRACHDADADVVDIADTWSAQSSLISSETIDTGQTLRDIERKVIHQVMKRHGNDRGRTAASLGISIRTLYNKLMRFQSSDDNN